SPCAVVPDINVGGVITKIQKIYLKNQSAMLFVTIEDMTSNIEILVFPKILESTGSVWQEDQAVLVSGKVSDKDGAFKVLADNAKKIDQRQVEEFRRISATQKANHHGPNLDFSRLRKVLLDPGIMSGKEDFRRISDFLNTCPKGQTKIFIKVSATKLETPFSVLLDEKLLRELEALVPRGRIEYN
ncbi:MAG: OB-fold nucleic acid binding domain-containing protein, partial [Patescibacteria group bacterium]